MIDPVDTATRGRRRPAASTRFQRLHGSPDPDLNIYQFVATTGSRDYAGYTNPRLDLILANAARPPHGVAKTLYHVAEQILLHDRPIIILYHAVTRAGLAKQLQGVTLYPDTLLRVAFAQYK